MKLLTNAKRLLSLLLALSLLLSFAVPFAGAEGTERTEPQPAQRETGYGLINQYHYGTNAVTDAYLRGETLTVNGKNLTQPKRDILPSKYDSRDYNYVTSVKNQNPYGSCWAHAAVASVESYMIKHGIPVGTGAAATTSLNLSETQHCFFNYSSAYDAEGMLTGDKCTLTGGDSCLDTGGNGEMSSYTLQRWTGVASESVSALAYNRASTVASSGLNSQYAYGSNVAHVQNSEWIPATNTDAVKQAIMSYGAGNISYYETGNAYTYICTIDKTSQDSSSHKWANHAITLVGWDDTIAVSNFKPNRPSKPGAWICKNSWGTGNFNSGYCYISYEDTSVLEGYIYFYDAESIDNYDHNYQYDGTCNVVCFGKGWSNSIGYYEGFANNTQVANVFTAKGNERLEAVALCNWDEALSYTVEIYKNPSAGNPSSGTLMTSQTGSLTFSGYYTIPLEHPVSLAAGDTFSVVFTQEVPVADESGKYVHTPYDANFNNSEILDWATWTHVNHGNTSYYKEPNGTWKDCPDNGDYRIKAFTKDVTFSVTAISNNTSYGTVSVDGSTITAFPADGYYVESCTVLSGNASCTIQGNTISVAATGDCTIQVNFAPKPTYTVQFVASGKAEGSETAQVNDTITLPASVSVNPAGWTFSGWTDQQIEETTEQPVLYAPGAAYPVTGNTTLYAVYTRVEEGSGETVYQLVHALEDGGNYIIVDNASISGTTGYAVGNSIAASNHYLKGISVTVNGDDTVTVSTSNLDNVLWQAAAVSGGYTFYNAKAGKYMGLDSAEYLYPSASALAWAYTAEGYLDNQVDSEGYYYLSFDTSNIRYTTNKNGKLINFYQETTLSTTYYGTDPVAAAHKNVNVYVVDELDGNELYAWAFGDAGNLDNTWPGRALNAEGTEKGGHSYYKLELDVTDYNKLILNRNGQPQSTDLDVAADAGDNDYVVYYIYGVSGNALQVSEGIDLWPAPGVVTAPSCTEAGFTTYTGMFTGEIKTENETPALGHDFGAWTITTAPTCTEAGEETRSCARCGAVETQTVDALGHTPAEAVEENRVEPTGTTEGHYDSVVYCAVCGVELSRETILIPKKQMPTILGHSLSTAGAIQVNIYASIPEELVQAGAIYYSFGDADEKQPITASMATDNGYRFTISCAAKNLHDPQTLTFYDADGNLLPMLVEEEEVSSHSYSVQEYLNFVIGSDSDILGIGQEKFEKLVALCKAMSDYGRYAQIQKGYEPDQLEDPYAEAEIDAVTAEDTFNAVSGTNVSYYGISVLTRSETVIRVYFRIVGEAENYLAYIDGGSEGLALTRYGTTSYYYVDIENISAKDLGKQHTVRVSDGSDEALVEGYSVYCYVASVLRTSSDEDLIKVVKALKYYGEKAAQYFAE